MSIFSIPFLQSSLWSRTRQASFALVAAGAAVFAMPATAQQSEWVWGGQIWDDNEANQYCPQTCADNGGQWTGFWEYQDEANSFCDCQKNVASGGGGGFDNNAATAAPAPAPAPAPSGGGDFANSVLAAHNAVRSNHGAAPLSWSSTLAASAQAYASTLQQNGCAGGHSPAHIRPGAGENLASRGSTTPSFGDVGRLAVDGWYWCEIGKYDPNNPVFSLATGHYTQVVWNNTRELGCAVAQCDANSQQVWPGRPFHVARVICHYGPSGNYEGQFSQNVRHQFLQKPAHVQCN